jgi:hypothetical protein
MWRSERSTMGRLSPSESAVETLLIYTRWAYDNVEALRDAGIEVPDVSAPGKHLLSDGTRITAERRDRADAAANVAKVGD